MPRPGASCDDGNICTDDQCDGLGVCDHPNNTAPCDDTLYCNGAETCDATLDCQAGTAPDWVLPAGQTVQFDILVELDQDIVAGKDATNDACVSGRTGARRLSPPSAVCQNPRSPCDSE